MTTLSPKERKRNKCYRDLAKLKGMRKRVVGERGGIGEETLFAFWLQGRQLYPGDREKI
jgi:hypothetical protein